MAGAGAVPVALGFALFAPFFLDFYAVTNGVKKVETPSILGEWFTFWGIFLIVVTVAIAFEFVRSLRRGWQPDAWYGATLVLGIAGITGIFTSWSDRGDVTSFAVAVVWSTALVAMAAGATTPSRWLLAWLPPVVLLAGVGAALLPSRPAAGLALSVVAASALFALRFRRSPRRFYPWALIAVAFATIGATELVYVVDDLDGGDWFRMNTVFKFYLPAWILLGVGCGVLLARMWRGVPLAWLSARQPLGAVARPTEVSISRRTTKQQVLQTIALPVLTGTATAALALGLVYPVVATPVRLEQDMPTSPDWLTLDGYAWMRNGWILNGTGQTIEYGGDLAAIEWLSKNVDEPAVILEGAIGPYRGNGSRISSGTGFPTVIGWARHQEQQRYREDIAPRVADVHTLYNTTNLNLKLELLRRYQVRYVVVGDVERLWNTPDQPRPYASAAGLRAFDELVGSGLEVAFESGHTTVYEVLDFPRRAPAPGAIHDL